MDVIKQPRPLIERWILVGIALVSWALCLGGIQRELPYVPDIDEPIFVPRAVHMAATGDLNPGWFGNPASTTIYPLAAGYRVWPAVSWNGSLLRPDLELQSRYEANPAAFYLLGRYLMASYFVLSVVLTYQIGRRIFGRAVGLIGAWLLTIAPMAVGYAQLVRSDSPATFFGLLSLWLCLKIYDHPSLRHQILAGLAIGLAIASRYFMVALVPALLLMDLLVLRKRTRTRSTRSLVGAGAIGLLAIGLGFALSTPYFFLDFAKAQHDLQVEARSTHLGADGLSPIGNLAWYLSTALPASVTWPVVILAGIGLLLIFQRRDRLQLWLAGFVGVFMFGICISPLHWQRWLIQILPVVSLLAADALVALLRWIMARVSATSVWRVPLGVTCVVLVSLWPMRQVVVADISQSNPSTRVLARHWVVQNIPTGSKIVEEWYTAPLDGTGFVPQVQTALATTGSPEDWVRDGYRYVIASSGVYGRFFAEPEKYAKEIGFYQALFAQGHLLQQIEPSLFTPGPTIRIYELSER
jgi:hypothetical protein